MLDQPGSAVNMLAGRQTIISRDNILTIYSNSRSRNGLRSLWETGISRFPAGWHENDEVASLTSPEFYPIEACQTQLDSNHIALAPAGRCPGNDASSAPRCHGMLVTRREGSINIKLSFISPRFAFRSSCCQVSPNSR